jgi:hypothetical protein
LGNFFAKSQSKYTSHEVAMGLTLFKGKAMTFPWGKENSFEAIGLWLCATNMAQDELTSGELEPIQQGGRTTNGYHNYSLATPSIKELFGDIWDRASGGVASNTRGVGILVCRSINVLARKVAMSHV